MKIKNAKKTLISSVIAIMVCFTMLIGTTFAWFTDTETSGINKIQSGNLDVGLQYANVYSLSFEEVDENTPIFMDVNGDPILWEPGAWTSGRIEVANNGSLALKYQLKIIYANATETPDGKTLADVLSIYALTRNKSTGTDAVMEDANLESLQIDSAVPSYDPQNMPLFKDGFVVEGYLLPEESITYEVGICWNPSDNDNEFNVAGGLSIDFAVALLATQMNYENDGDGFYYDMGAEFPEEPSIPAPVSIWNGEADLSWYNENETEFTLTSASAFAGFACLVDGSLPANYS
ncbi:MAG: SipW-dependent-type signal peptide-containing protein, partial [Clostridia bacterium]|nr:SipW-dependent-type signal peptide-containing protein [Clostridia bacterium]